MFLAAGSRCDRLPHFLSYFIPRCTRSSLPVQISRHPVEARGERYQIGLDIGQRALLRELPQPFGNSAVSFHCRPFNVVHRNTRRAILLTQRQVKRRCSKFYQSVRLMTVE